MRKEIIDYFIFDLRECRELKGKYDFFNHAVRYYNEGDKSFVDIGYGLENQLTLEAGHWNRILRIIRNNELDDNGIKAIVNGLMGKYLRDCGNNLISAIRTGAIRKIDTKG